MKTNQSLLSLDKPYIMNNAKLPLIVILLLLIGQLGQASS